MRKGYCLSLLLLLCIIFSTFNLAHAQEKMRVAVLDFEGIGISELDARALSEQLRVSISQCINDNDLLSGKYDILERSQMDKIFDEFKIQSTGCTDISCAVELGKMLSVDTMIIGSVSLVGQTYNIISRIVDVETSKINRAINRQHKGAIDDVLKIMPIIADDLFTGSVKTVIPAPQPDKQPTISQAKPPVKPQPEQKEKKPARETTHISRSYFTMPEELYENDVPSIGEAKKFSWGISYQYKSGNPDDNDVDIKLHSILLKGVYNINDRIQIMALVPYLRYKVTYSWYDDYYSEYYSESEKRDGVGDIWIGGKFSLQDNVAVRTTARIPISDDYNSVGAPGGYGIDIALLSRKGFSAFEMTDQVGLRWISEDKYRYQPGMGFYAESNVWYPLSQSVMAHGGLDYYREGNPKDNGSSYDYSSYYLKMKLGIILKSSSSFSLLFDLIYVLAGENTFKYFSPQVSIGF